MKTIKQCRFLGQANSDCHTTVDLVDIEQSFGEFTEQLVVAIDNSCENHSIFRMLNELKMEFEYLLERNKYQKKAERLIGIFAKL